MIRALARAIEMRCESAGSLIVVGVFLLCLINGCGGERINDACRQVDEWGRRVKLESEYITPEVERSMRAASTKAERIKVMIAAKRLALDRIRVLADEIRHRNKDHQLFDRALDVAIAYERFQSRDIELDLEALAGDLELSAPDDLSSELRDLERAGQEFDQLFEECCGGE